MKKKHIHHYIASATSLLQIYNFFLLKTMLIVIKIKKVYMKTYKIKNKNVSLHRRKIFLL